MMKNSVVGLGNDILEIERIREGLQAHGERFLERVLTPNERTYCAAHQDLAPHVAARFSAKEAIVKALGVGIGEQISWQDIEILNDEKGKPHVTLSKRLDAAFQSPKLLLSISHCKHYVSTVAILLT